MKIFTAREVFLSWLSSDKDFVPNLVFLRHLIGNPYAQIDRPMFDVMSALSKYGEVYESFRGKRLWSVEALAYAKAFHLMDSLPVSKSVYLKRLFYINTEEEEPTIPYSQIKQYASNKDEWSDAYSLALRKEYFALYRNWFRDRTSADTYIEEVKDLWS